MLVLSIDSSNRFFRMLLLGMLLGALLPLLGEGEGIYAAERTGSPFEVTEFLPDGVVNGPALVRVTFSNPVVASDDVGRRLDLEEMPIRIEPKLVGHGMWTSQLTFIYQPPRGYFKEATEYTVEIDKNLKDLSGKSLSGGRVYKVRTPSLRFTGLRQVAYSLEENTVDYAVAFSAPVNPAALEERMRVLDEKGNPVKYLFLNSNPSPTARIRADAGDGSPIRVEIDKGLTSTVGPLGLAEAVSAKGERDLSLKIQASHARSGWDGNAIVLETTSPIDLTKAKSFIEVKPDRNFVLDAWGSTLQIKGEFEPREMVTLGVRKGLPAEAGPPMREAWSRVFVFPDVEPSLNFDSPGLFISPAGESLMVPINTINIEKLSLRISRIYDNNVSYAARRNWPNYTEDNAETIHEATYSIQSEPNETVRSSIDLARILAGRRGLFEVMANRSGHWPSISKVINVTDIAGTAKIFDRGALFWVNSISEGKPIKGVRVTLYSNANQMLGEGTTDRQGICTMEMKNGWKPELQPSLALFQYQEDIAILNLERSVWQRGDERYDGVPYSRGAYQGICYTARGVFRPGERVPVGLIVRERDLSLKEPFPVELKVFTSRGGVWQRETTMLSEMGMASADILLSDASPTGTWRIKVHIPGEEVPFAETTFMVEDFVPPRITVETSSDKKILNKEEQGTIAIFAKYLFGAPGGSLNYEVEGLVIPREYQHPDWKGYTFSDRRVQGGGKESKFGEGQLSPEGYAQVSFPADMPKLPSMADLNVRAGVMEDNGRWVYRTLTLPYYPTPFFIGIKEQGSLPAGQSARFEIVALKPDGTPISPKGAKFWIERREYRTIVSTSNGRQRSERRTEYMPLPDYQGIALEFTERGEAAFETSFDLTGSYRLIVADEKEGVASTSDFYVSTAGWLYPMDEKSAAGILTIELNQELYKPGEEVKAVVKGDFEGALLFTVETDEMLYHQVQALPKEGASFSFKVTEAMSPNAWITAHLIRAAHAEESQSEHRAFAAVPLNVDCASKALSLDLISPERLQMLKENHFKLKLTDARGRGVRGEVDLMLIDEGVLELTRFHTPNFWDYYVNRRGLSIQAYDVYDDLMRIYRTPPPPLVPGGGAMMDAENAMMKSSLSPVKADRFKILTICKRLETDASGNLDFSLTLPEFSGKARLMLVAASESAFGAKEAFYEVARDVVAEVALPRALAPGDFFESAILLFNRSGRELPVTLEMNLEGPLLLAKSRDAEPEKWQKSYRESLTLPSSESAYRIPLYVKCEDVAGTAKVVLTTTFPGDAPSVLETEIAVRPPYPRITKSGWAVVEPGANLEVSFDRNWFPGTQYTRLAISGMPQIELSDAASFLLNYPYGCLEQTVSGGWALLSLPELVQDLDPNLATPEQLAGAIQERIRTLQSMQMYNGAFMAWPQSPISEWGSAYAVHFLLACEREGIAVPKESLRAALDYLQNLLAATPSGESEVFYASELALRAYISYILALAGQTPFAWMAYLRDNLEHMPEYGKIILSAAYARSGELPTARSLIGEKSPPLNSYALPVSEDRNLDSDLRTQALFLLAWNEIDPQSETALLAAGELLDSLRKRARPTTQEAGFAMQSLAEYFKRQGAKGTPNVSVRTVENEEILKLSTNKNVIKSIGDDINPINIKNTGDGVAYLSWAVDGVPTRAPAAKRHVLDVTLEYLDSSGRRIEPGRVIRRGERLTGRVVLSSYPLRTNNIVFVLPLPGGFEIENPKLMDPQNQDGSVDGGGYSKARAELRDDRFILFVDDIYKPFEWKFAVRAVTAGRFLLPPFAAEGMYSPGIYNIGETSFIDISSEER